MSKIWKTSRDGVRNALCILAVLLFLQCSLVENLASQTLSGKVFTVEVGGDTVPVYMARLQWLHTAVGTHTKKDGSYQLSFSRTDTLIVSYSFYKADTLVVSAEESHRDFFINTSQALKEVVISKKRQKYVRKGNPAIELVKQVIEHKNDNRIESAESFRTTKYKKLVMAFGRFDLDLHKNRFRRQFSFLEKYIDTILTTIEEAAKVRGTGIAKRSHEYLATKMREAKAVIALSGDRFAGFSYIETWGNKQYVTTSGLIVHPDFRGLGIARRIKDLTFTLARTRWPHAKIFSLTSGAAVMAMNTRLGYQPVTFADLTDDEAFWRGCEGCINFDVLQRTNRRYCICTAMLYDPEEHLPAKIPDDVLQRIRSIDGKR